MADESLSGGAIVGIVVSSVFVLAFLLDIACCHLQQCGVMWSLHAKICGADTRARTTTYEVGSEDGSLNIEVEVTGNNHYIGNLPYNLAW